jgi:flagellar biosynthetic protein FlhB
VAKGRGEVAARIREQAERHQVPIVQDVPLARTIEATVAIGGEIPEQLNEAVARVLAFLARLRTRATWGGPLQMPQVAG